MGRRAAVVLYVLAMVAIIVSVDVLFFRHQFWERLIVNVGIVAVFAGFYLRIGAKSDQATIPLHHNARVTLAADLGSVRAANRDSGCWYHSRRTRCGASR